MITNSGGCNGNVGTMPSSTSGCIIVDPCVKLPHTVVFLFAVFTPVIVGFDINVRNLYTGGERVGNFDILKSAFNSLKGFGQSDFDLPLQLTIDIVVVVAAVSLGIGTIIKLLYNCIAAWFVGVRAFKSVTVEGTVILEISFGTGTLSRSRKAEFQNGIFLQRPVSNNANRTPVSSAVISFRMITVGNSIIRVTENTI